MKEVRRRFPFRAPLKLFQLNIGWLRRQSAVSIRGNQLCGPLMGLPAVSSPGDNCNSLSAIDRLSEIVYSPGTTFVSVDTKQQLIQKPDSGTDQDPT